jgi:hypothetical protein
MAQPAEPHDLQLIPRHVILEYELTGHGDLPCPQAGLSMRSSRREEKE